MQSLSDCERPPQNPKFSGIAIHVDTLHVSLAHYCTETSDAKKHALMRPMELFYAKLKPALKRTLQHNKAAAKAAGGVASRRDMSLSRKDWPRAVLKHVFLSLQASRCARGHYLCATAVEFWGHIELQAIT